jgi:hypothetical protein
LRPKTVVETGVAQGVTLRFILEALKRTETIIFGVLIFHHWIGPGGGRHHHSSWYLLLSSSLGYLAAVSSLQQLPLTALVEPPAGYLLSEIAPVGISVGPE